MVANFTPPPPPRQKPRTFVPPPRVPGILPAGGTAMSLGTLAIVTGVRVTEWRGERIWSGQCEFCGLPRGGNERCVQCGAPIYVGPDILRKGGGDAVDS